MKFLTENKVEEIGSLLNKEANFISLKDGKSWSLEHEGDILAFCFLEENQSLSDIVLDLPYRGLLTESEVLLIEEIIKKYLNSFGRELFYKISFDSNNRSFILQDYEGNIVDTENVIISNDRDAIEEMVNNFDKEPFSLSLVCEDFINNKYSIKIEECNEAMSLDALLGNSFLDEKRKNRMKYTTSLLMACCFSAGIMGSSNAMADDLPLADLEDSIQTTKSYKEYMQEKQVDYYQYEQENLVDKYMEMMNSQAELTIKEWSGSPTHENNDQLKKLGKGAFKKIFKYHVKDLKKRNKTFQNVESYSKSLEKKINNSISLNKKDKSRLESVKNVEDTGKTKEKELSLSDLSINSNIDIAHQKARINIDNVLLNAKIEADLHGDSKAQAVVYRNFNVDINGYKIEGSGQVIHQIDRSRTKANVNLNYGSFKVQGTKDLNSNETKYYGGFSIPFSALGWD